MKSKAFSSEDVKLLKRALTYNLKFKWRYIFVIFTNIALIIISVVEPLLYGELITTFINKSQFKQIVNIVSFLIVIYVIKVIIQISNKYLELYIRKNILENVKCTVFKKITGLSLKQLYKIKFGSLTTYIHSDSNAIVEVIMNDFMRAIIDVLTILCIGYVIIRINLLLFFMVLLSFPITYCIYVKYGDSLRKKNRHLKKLEDKYFNNIQQYITGIEEIKSFGIIDKINRRFSMLLNNIKIVSIKISQLNFMADRLAGIVDFIIHIGFIIVGGYLVFVNKLDIKFFIAFSSYSKLFSNSLLKLTRLNSNLQRKLISLKRVFGFLDIECNEEEEIKKININNVKGHIQFKNVSFSYDDINLNIKNINLDILPNQKIAIIGKSGSGKTTILKLLINLYSPSAGNILVDDIDIESVNKESLRKQITIVRQEAFLFNLSIKENLLLVNDKLTDYDIVQACKKAYIHDDIMNLPEKYETVLKNTGVNLSVGQKQRLAIARAFLKKSKVILFDEPTSGLDNISQDYINKVIDELSNYHTVIVTAHRLNIIKDYDQIILIDKGEIIAQGIHEELIKENLVYKQLFDLCS